MEYSGPRPSIKRPIEPLRRPEVLEDDRAEVGAIHDLIGGSWRDV
ncbi:hypothetical protein [Geitlerinema sp. P-1104]|nr:hypothetical protein [Geitlerinema sp. P-1104]